MIDVVVDVGHALSLKIRVGVVLLVAGGGGRSAIDVVVGVGRCCRKDHPRGDRRSTWWSASVVLSPSKFESASSSLSLVVADEVRSTWWSASDDVVVKIFPPGRPTIDVVVGVSLALSLKIRVSIILLVAGGGGRSAIDVVVGVGRCCRKDRPRGD
jgi:hypothetical protein